MGTTRGPKKRSKIKHLIEILTVPGNTVLLTSVSINKKVDNGINPLLVSNVLRKCTVSPTVLTRVHNNCVPLQLENFSDDDVNLKIGTNLYEAEYYNDENDNVLMQNTIVSNANDNNDNVVKSSVTDKSDKGTLPLLSLEDIKCDHVPAKEQLLDIVNENRHVTWQPDEPLDKYQGDQFVELSEWFLVMLCSFELRAINGF